MLHFCEIKVGGKQIIVNIMFSVEEAGTIFPMNLKLEKDNNDHCGTWTGCLI